MCELEKCLDLYKAYNFIAFIVFFWGLFGTKKLKPIFLPYVVFGKVGKYGILLFSDIISY